MTSIFTGAATALVTPFTQEGIQLKAMARLLDQQLANGIRALIVNGTTGEPATMTAREREEVAAFVLEYVGGRVPVIAGAGSNSTRDAAENAACARRLGADAVLVVTPYYNKCNADGLVAHFHAVADAAGIPVIVYNVPSRTNVNITPEVLCRIAEHPLIRGVKEASGNISQLMAMARLCPRLDFYCGNDELNLAALACGAKGVISVASNVAPREVATLTEAVFAGKMTEAYGLQQRLNPLIEALFIETNPIPVKTALNLMGLEAGPLRLPLAPMTEAHTALLKKAMADFGVEAFQ